MIPADHLALLRERTPLVHHITNAVTIASCADITLAVGGSPVMADSPDEATQMVQFAGALVLNMGTLHRESVRAMVEAGRAAKERGCPVVFDPVGAGATAFRQETALRIMTEVTPDIVKGNLAEIGFLAGAASQQRGVDSLESGDAAESLTTACAKRWGTIAAATGVVDCVSDGAQVVRITGGTPLLGRITGTGCMAASLVGCFAAVCPERLTAAILGLLLMKRAGELAAHACGGPLPGTGDFRRELLNAASRFDGSMFDWDQRVRHAFA